MGLHKQCLKGETKKMEKKVFFLHKTKIYKKEDESRTPEGKLIRSKLNNFFIKCDNGVSDGWLIN